MICPVCEKGKVLPSKKKSTKPGVVNLRCMRPACQAKFVKETVDGTSTIRRVA